MLSMLWIYITMKNYRLLSDLYKLTRGKIRQKKANVPEVCCLILISSLEM